MTVSTDDLGKSSSISKPVKSKETPISSLRFPGDIGNYPLTAIYITRVDYVPTKKAETYKTQVKDLVSSVVTPVRLATATIAGVSNALSAATGMEKGEVFTNTTNALGIAEKGVNRGIGELIYFTNCEKVEKEIIQIFLPLPMNLQSDYIGGWGGMELSSLQYNIRELLKGNLSKDQAIENLAEAGTMEVLKGFVGKMGGGPSVRESVGAIGAAGIGFNPYKELMYSSPDFRRFQLEWVLSPRNEKESDELNHIVWVLKKYMHPVPEGNSLEESYFFRYPEYCKIELWRNESKVTNGEQTNPYLFKFDQCAITQVTVRYDNKLHRDSGAPTVVSLSLGLLEKKILTQRDFEQDYKKNTTSY